MAGGASPGVEATRALSGTRVVEIASGMAGELAGLVLAQYGADVLKIERPGGARSRRRDGFALWNAGKRNLDLDLTAAAGRADLGDLVGEADVVVQALREETVGRLGVGYDALSAVNRRLVYCAVSGFDPGSPYAHLPGTEGLVATRMGRGSIWHDQLERSGPLYPAVPVGAFGAAHGVLQGVLLALRRRDRGGGGTHLHTSLLRGVITYDMWDWFSPQFPEEQRHVDLFDEQGRHIRPGGNAFLVVSTKDGRWMHFANLESHLFYRVMRAIGLERLYEEPEYAGLPNSIERPAMLRVRRLILERLREKTYEEWAAIFDADGNIAYEIIRQPEEVPEHPQIEHNGHFLNDQGRLTLNAPWTVNGERPAVAHSAARVSAEGPAWGSRPRPAPTAWGGGSAGGGVGDLLRGVTVLELASYYAGPLATRLLADYGARVIKVEPLTGDPMRAMSAGLSNAQATMGKESISLDLKSATGQRVLHRLIARADALLHNYRPGTAESLGFGVEDTRRINPNLVYTYSAAYGSSGPICTRPAYDPIPASITAVATRQGGGCLPPSREATLAMDADQIAEYSRRIGLTSEGVCDVSAAVQAASALCYGLLARERLGTGVVVESTMLGASILANSEVFDRREPVSDRLRCEGLGLSPLYRLYPSSAGWLFLSCRDAQSWDALRATLLAGEAIAECDFETAWQREELNGVLERRFAAEPAGDWEMRCLAAGVACLAVPASRADLPLQDWIHEGGIMAPVRDHFAGAYYRYAPLIFGDGEACPERGVPMIGEQTVPILQELGFSAEEVGAAVAERHARAWDPVPPALTAVDLRKRIEA